MLKKIDKKITNSKIFLMGLAFKGAPKTSDIRSSTSMDFINLFSNKKNLYVYDPVVYKSELKKNNLKSLSLEKGFTKADAVIILNNNKSFQDLDITNLINKMNKPSLFIDTWRIFDPHEIKQIKGILYGGLGIE